MRLPGSAPKAERVVWEAMAETLNPHGNPYSCGDAILLPGEWIEVSPRQAERLHLMPWATLRQRGAE